MADSVTINVEGLQDVMKRLEELGTNGQERAIKKALVAAATIEQAAIVERAPVKDTTGGSLPIGAIRSDIEIHYKKSKDGYQYAVIGPGKMTKFVSRLVEYGHRLTVGRSSLNKKTGKTKGPGVQIGNVPEHPFIRPAYEESRQLVVDTMTKTLLVEIDKEVKKGGK